MSTFETSREIAATPEQIFDAFRQPERLAKWWGPAGFTVTNKSCDFKVGGRWVFTMHGPNGAIFPNESIFAEIEAPGTIVIQHACEPKYRLTVGITKSGNGSRVTWSQVFEKADVAERIKHIVIPANEQNLDKLTQEVLG